MHKLIAVATTGPGVLTASAILSAGAVLPLTGAAVAVLSLRATPPPTTFPTHRDCNGFLDNPAAVRAPRHGGSSRR